MHQEDKKYRQLFECALCVGSNPTSDKNFFIFELFKEASDLRIHFLKVHQDKCRSCVSCDKIFVEKEALKNHISTIHERIKDYKCDTCSKTFNISKSLKQHIHTVHEGHRDYKCEPCGKSFSTTNSLKKHILAVYEGRNDQKCTICGKIFSRKGYLKIHSLSHVNDEEKRDFSSIREGCDLCEKSFLNLKKHIRLFHETPKEFSCDACDKSFTSSRHFRR